MLITLLCSVFHAAEHGHIAKCAGQTFLVGGAGGGGGENPRDLVLSEIDVAFKKDPLKFTWHPNPHTVQIPEQQMYEWQYQVMGLPDSTSGMRVSHEYIVRSAERYPVRPENPPVEWIADKHEHKSYAYCHLYARLGNGVFRITGNVPVRITQAVSPKEHTRKKQYILPHSPLTDREFNERLMIQSRDNATFRVASRELYEYKHAGDSTSTQYEGSYSLTDTTRVAVKCDGKLYQEGNGVIYPYISIFWREFEGGSETYLRENLLSSVGFSIRQKGGYRRGTDCYIDTETHEVDLSQVNGPASLVIKSTDTDHITADVHWDWSPNPFNSKQTFKGNVSQKPARYPQVLVGTRCFNPGFFSRNLYLTGTWNSMEEMWNDPRNGETRWP